MTTGDSVFSLSDLDSA